MCCRSEVFVCLRVCACVCVCVCVCCSFVVLWFVSIVCLSVCMCFCVLQYGIAFDLYVVVLCCVLRCLSASVCFVVWVVCGVVCVSVCRLVGWSVWFYVLKHGIYHLMRMFMFMVSVCARAHVRVASVIACVCVCVYPSRWTLRRICVGAAPSHTKKRCFGTCGLSAGMLDAVLKYLGTVAGRRSAPPNINISPDVYLCSEAHEVHER